MQQSRIATMEEHEVLQEHSNDERFFIPPEFMPRYDDCITENDNPVNNLFSEKQMRLLTEPLYSSWQAQHPRYGAKFLALANVDLAEAHAAELLAKLHSLGIEP
jgi:hypothetical protein